MITKPCLFLHVKVQAAQCDLGSVSCHVSEASERRRFESEHRRLLLLIKHHQHCSVLFRSLILPLSTLLIYHQLVDT